ncbi:MAG: acetyl-CoA C-acetyltransferase [Promethearchaeota archaeon]
MKDVYICYARRTAIGKFGGSLLPYNAGKILSFLLKDVVETTGIDPKVIGDVKAGCCLEPIQEMNVARVATLLAGYPIEVPAMTIDRVCTSAMEAIRSGMVDIQAGYADVVLAGGVEAMSNVPYFLPDARWGARLQNKEMLCGIMEGLHAGSKAFDKTGYLMGETAERVADKYGITREEMDEAALRSHNNAERATNEGRFKDEIVPVPVKTRRKEYVFDKDEHFRPGLTIEALQRLPPVFRKDGRVTAGNASGINDGAALTLLTTKDRAEELGLPLLAKIVAVGIAGNDPQYMGVGPIYSVPDALKRASMKMTDVDLVECNEAFASPYVACAKELKWDFDATNVNGSGIGLGHPVGCTGARIVVTLVHEMRKRGVTHGLATLCGGGGVSEAIIVENV